MKSPYEFIYRSTIGLAIISTLMLILNMVAIPIFEEQVFQERGTISMDGEMVILLGFVLILLFNVVSVLWGVLFIRKTKIVLKRELWVLALGTLCLILMAGEKTMIDEIGREYQIGWETIGEWIILYLFLAIQLLYNVVILQRMYRISKYSSS